MRCIKDGEGDDDGEDDDERDDDGGVNDGEDEDLGIPLFTSKPHKTPIKSLFVFNWTINKNSEIFVLTIVCGKEIRGNSRSWL